MSNPLTETFRDEALELFEELEGAMLALEENPQDVSLIDQAFRALHTLKGSSGLVGFDEVSAFCHEAESVFDLVRAGQRQVDRDLISLTLSALDHLKKMLLAAFDGSLVDHGQTLRLVAAFQALIPSSPEDVSGASDEIPSEQAADTFSYRIRFRPSPDIFHQGIRPQLLLNELGSLGEVIIVAQLDAVPRLDELDPEQCLVYWDIILTTSEQENAIRDVFIFVEDDCELSLQVVDDSGLIDGAEDYKRLGEILVEKGDLPRQELDNFLSGKKKLGESLVEAGVVNSEKVESALAEQERIQKLRRQRLTVEASDSIRVKSERLDKLVNLIGEMVTVQARLSQVAGARLDPELQAVAEEVERLTWDLRDQVLTIRMVPIGGTFSKFKRMVRDLSTNLGKDVMLVIEGAETELDKTLVDRLNDPLVHLIRNCIDHGVEPPAVRRAAGKPSRGCITLSARHSGASVLLTVADDGFGLNFERIKATALSRGLISPQSELSGKEISNLIFEPGFSTAEGVSSVSGRGVGMDVVRQAIDALRGSIEIVSKPGQGTRFVIKLPLTLAIIDGLLVNIVDKQFILPLSAVEECVELTAADSELAHGRNLVRVRGEIVPYVRLRDEFALPGNRPAIEQIVIANLEGQRIGFVVDHVIGEHQTVIKSLGRMYQNVNGVSGATILGDGRVALIVDLVQLAEGARKNESKSLG
jgi:two-component system chemotaxis sensor kinase CheA